MTAEEALFSELIDTLKEGTIKDANSLNRLKIRLARKYGVKRLIKNGQIIAHASDEDRDMVKRALNIKPIRDTSGVNVVALFAKPHSCPHGKCMYCPGGPDSPFGDTPQSYTGQEPAAMRAIRNHYDPYLQIFNRLEHYVVNGHRPDKLELIFMGGTFPSLDKEYRDEFVRNVYKAINDFGELFIREDENGKLAVDYTAFIEFFESKGDLHSQERQLHLQEKMLAEKEKNQRSMEEEIIRNETAKIRAIGLTIETKPDWALQEHCDDMLRYGCTRLELGVQTLDDKCLKKTNRGHGLQETIDSFQVAKDMCLKINAHMMLGLPASTLEKDKQSLIDLFADERFRPDMLKIYPCLVVKGTPLYTMWEKGLFTPISTEDAARIIAECYAHFPRYVRVMRVQRDIPTTVVHGGVQKSNLRQYVDAECERLEIESQDIRAREVGFREAKGYQPGTFGLQVSTFDASKGKEYFIDVTDEEDTLIGFIRLRLPYESGLRPEITSDTALIRELHVYGHTVPVGEKGEHQQHKGWGRKLVEKAEEIAKEQGYERMAIISGVGVREYYRRLGYEREGPYMCKTIYSS